MLSKRSLILLISTLWCLSGSAQSLLISNFQRQLFKEIYRYSMLRSDSAVILMNQLEPSIDFEKEPNLALEYYLAQTDISINLKAFADAESHLQNAEQYRSSEQSEVSQLKLDAYQVFYQTETKRQTNSAIAEIHRKALKTQDKDLLLLTYQLLARDQNMRGLAHESQETIDEALTFFEGSGTADNLDIGTLQFAKGNFYLIAVNYPLALKYFTIAESYYEESKHFYGLANIYNSKGVILRNRGFYSDALEQYYKCYAIYDDLFIDFNKAYTLNNIGLVHSNQQDHQQAILNYERALDLISEFNADRGYAYILSNLGKSLLAIGKFDEAEQQLLESISIKNEINDIRSVGYSQNILGDIYIEREEYQKAIQMYTSTIVIAKEMQTKKDIAEAHLGLSKAYQKLGDYPKARLHASKALNMAIETDVLDEQYLAKVLLAQIEEKSGNPSRALSYLKKSNALKDSIDKVNKAQELEILNIQFENQQNKLAIAELETDNIRKDGLLQINQQRTRLLTLLSIAFLIALASLLWVYLLKQRTNKSLEDINSRLEESIEKYKESNNQLEQFAHIASHDLKSPVKTITSFARLLKEQSAHKLDKQENTFLEFIQSSSQNLSHLIEDLLDYSKVNSQKVKHSAIQANTLVQDVLDSVSDAAHRKNVNLSIEGALPDFRGDKIKIGRVFQNLITNAIKFADAEKASFVKIQGQKVGNTIEFKIIDNGIGIKETKTDIFKPFTHLNQSPGYKGTGMGLAFCKKIIEQHGGEIEYDSTYGEGTTFTFKLQS